MKINWKKIPTYLGMLFLVGCAGLEKDCSSCSATSFGGDWIITQNRLDGTPFNCWKAKGVSISNEHGSDGIWWQSGTGHLIHIAGSYTRVQVMRGDWAGAAKEVGVDLSKCTNGHY